ncbi:hypothetical protein J3R30DRAFT_3864432 [Lentinula aciculospora]|uniref:Uncharacterized protein n=1 Tax=Lentinula aciculospora TaxID=153920 RepID=A0A9W9AFP0_9AGAR|nr:hypothetical protein J3R30DRAFT_3864432 [Lentinula aciculospora]
MKAASPRGDGWGLGVRRQYLEACHLYAQYSLSDTLKPWLETVNNYERRLAKVKQEERRSEAPTRGRTSTGQYRSRIPLPPLGDLLPRSAHITAKVLTVVSAYHNLESTTFTKSRPTKTIVDGNTWRRPWQATAEAISFAFADRRNELNAYETHTEHLFNDNLPRFHWNIIRYDRPCIGSLILDETSSLIVSTMPTSQGSGTPTSSLLEQISSCTLPHHLAPGNRALAPAIELERYAENLTVAGVKGSTSAQHAANLVMTPTAVRRTVRSGEGPTKFSTSRPSLAGRLQ